MRWSRPSLGRLVAGLLLFALGVVVALLAFQALPFTLDAYGHGSREALRLLVALGVSGGLVSIGTVLVIWEISVRLGRP